MPSAPRSTVVVEDEPGIYHCYTRVVQRAWLCGFDPVTNQDFSYRKEWVRAGLRRLARYMSLEVLDFAVLDNHLHVMARNRPDVSRDMTPRDVATRWCYLCRTAGLSEQQRRQRGRRPPRPTESQIRAIVRDPEKLAECRERLSSLSWMMRLLCQPIAWKANREAGTTGHFFADRFKCQRIEDEAGLLACAMYINMNPLRAGIVSTPAAADFTSGYARLQALLARQARGEDVLGELRPDPQDPDAWLAPVFLAPEAAALTSVDDYKCPVNMRESQQLDEAERDEAELDEGDDDDWQKDAGPADDWQEGDWQADAGDDSELEQLTAADDLSVPSESDGAALGPLWRGQRLVPETFSGRLTNKGYLPITAGDFLSLWDWTSQQLKSESAATMPADLATILARLGVESGEWLETVQSVDRSFSTSLGNVVSLQERAQQRGNKWLRGIRRAAVAFT